MTPMPGDFSNISLTILAPAVSCTETAAGAQQWLTGCPAQPGWGELLRSWKPALSKDFFRSTSAHMLMGKRGKNHCPTAPVGAPGDHLAPASAILP